ncbi:exo-alpha-sialidase [Aquicoccus sp. SCR17]|nr:exo-alpha-sialidase [Carideicomes alvinocaridis]
MTGRVTLLVGTTKGAFLLEAGEERADWHLRGPFCANWPINHMLGDPESGALWAAGGGEFPGAGVWRSQDGGESWQLSKLANGKFDEFLAADPDFAAQIGMEPSPPAPYTGQVDALWSLGRAGDTLYAGAKPATLYASRDGGESWAPVEGLTNHPSRESWQPGGAGLTLHTIVTVPDAPEKMWLGISAAGVFATEDGGESWDRRNRRSNAPSGEAHVHADGTMHDPGGEVGHCVHNMVRAGGSGDLLYQQNHEGVFRSSDGGRSWDEITAGLPSSFGFPVAVHPRDPQTLWVLPLSGDMGRFPPDNRAAVWKSTDGGESWSAKGEGLPAKNCFFTVLRQSMAVDRGEQVGLYFGTNSGSVFASRDEGESWDEIARHLPTVLCVEVMEQAA